MSFENKVVYRRFPITGEMNGKSVLQLFDLEKREEKKIIEGCGGRRRRAVPHGDVMAWRLPVAAESGTR